ncbi:MAG TPA: hypothetical protein ENI39_01350 [Anaerolineae bacterium]|nr:hypothetical protein [Anaerolineae bacterium]
MGKLPQFQTLDELVAFWDDHDFTDYIDEMEEVAEEGLPGQRQPTLRVVLDRRVWERLNQLADRRGTSLDQLARQWLEERIAHEMA